MPKLIFRSNYFRNEPAKHRSNFIKYLGTREGVELNPEMMPRFFYEDMDMHGKKENYVEYLAKRPRVEYNANCSHGLFSTSSEPINLEQVMDEVANHPGIVWINVISLKREDATELGYDNITSWQNLLRRHIADISANFHIEPHNLSWYAAFHNEGHHPHCHLVVFSRGKEGHLSKKGIDNMRSALNRDVFQNELAYIYSEKSKQRDSVKTVAQMNLLNSIKRIPTENYCNPAIEENMRLLSNKLAGIKGKKVYGYLHKNIKEIVDSIVDELAKEPGVAACYEDWFRLQASLYGYYKDAPIEMLPMSKNKEFKSIKNMIIREALKVNAAQSSEPINAQRMMANSALLFCRALERLFTSKIPPNERNALCSDSKTQQKEREKKIALGQKQDDYEEAPIVTQT